MQDSPSTVSIRAIEPSDVASILAWDSMPRGRLLEWLLLDSTRPVRSLVACEEGSLLALLPVVELGDPLPHERPPMFEWGRPLLAPGIDRKRAAALVRGLEENFLRGQDSPEGVVVAWFDTQVSESDLPLGFERLGCWSVLEGLPFEQLSAGKTDIQTVDLDENAAEFMRRCAPASAWVPRRSSAWLDWRYGRAPGGGHGARGVLERGELSALAVVGPAQSALGSENSSSTIPVLEFWVAPDGAGAAQNLVLGLGREARAQDCELSLAMPSWQPAFDVWVGAGLRLMPSSLDLLVRPAALAPEGRASEEAWSRRVLDLEALRCAWPWSLGDAHFSVRSSKSVHPRD
ncbi:MAG: hypothetical protein CMJ86_10805 [Planctomycetes bacterium]|nr:hypothetical protein [Planctomycetota bacterium]